MSGGDIPEDITMHLPLIHLRISSHVIRVDEVACYLVYGEGFCETLGSLLVLCDANDAHVLSRFWGETPFFLESGSTVTTGGADWCHDCGVKDLEVTSMNVSAGVKRALGAREGKVIHVQDGFSAGLVESPVCCLESCVLDTVSYRDGKRRQLRLWRMSTDINVDVYGVS